MRPMMRRRNMWKPFVFLSIFAFILSTGIIDRVSSQVVSIKWDNYTASDLQRDLSISLSQTASNFTFLVFQRYPHITKVVRDVLNQTSRTNGTWLSTLQLCSIVQSVFKNSWDACNARIISASLLPFCNDPKGNSSILGDKIAGLCEEPTTTSPPVANSSILPTLTPKQLTPTGAPTPKSNVSTMEPNGGILPGTMLPSNSFFLAIKALTGTVLEAHRRKCMEYGGTLNDKTMICTKNSTVIPLDSSTEDKALRIIGIVGHLISFLSCIALVVCYFIFKRCDTLPGKNTMCLSSSLALAHFIQLVLIFSLKEAWACRVGATLLHWALLLAFAWMAILAYEFYITFAKIRVVDKHMKKKRFRKYICISLTFATMLLFICLMIDIPKERHAGYGVKGCFVTGFWANLFAFVVPISVILLINIVLLVITIIKLRAIKTSTEQALTTSNTQSRRRKIVLSSLTLKLSILLGLGWLLAFVDGVYYSIVLRYFYTIIIASQGFLVFVCFGCHKETWNAFHGLISRKKHGVSWKSNADTITQQTSL